MAADMNGPVLVLAPHFDDETLGCGGWLAGRADKQSVRVVFACDGRGSPAYRNRRPAVEPAPDMGRVRRVESEAALAELGVPSDRMVAWDFPDGTLALRPAELDAALAALLAADRPAALLVPFRYDRHPDHEALCRAAWRRPEARDGRVRVLEYFVYYRRRLFPGGDIRQAVRPDYLRRLDLSAAQQAAKRRALDRYVTQTRPGAHGRPALTDAMVRAAAAGPELFLEAPPGVPERGLWTWPAWRMSLARLLENTGLRVRAVKRRQWG